MKKLLLTVFVVGFALSTQAGHFHGGGWHRGYCYRGGYGFYPGFSLSVGYPAYAYYPDSYYSYADYGYYGYYDVGRPNYAVGGTLLGALTGGLIGNSFHHQGWEGAAIGAGAGLLLGGIAEDAARRQERRVAATMYQASPAPQPQMQAQPQPQSSPPQSQITSKPCATSTYYWTTRPQIADAPRVPDAPGF
ncbi:MAG: hypothetical protein HY298_24620 [Verrucomicrobia bacterium]|nr:hypothetical protein [Verrucomicrobiota bacterium]